MDLNFKINWMLGFMYMYINYTKICIAHFFYMGGGGGET